MLAATWDSRVCHAGVDDVKGRTDCGQVRRLGGGDGCRQFGLGGGFAPSQSREADDQEQAHGLAVLENVQQGLALGFDGVGLGLVLPHYEGTGDEGEDAEDKRDHVIQKGKERLKAR